MGDLILVATPIIHEGINLLTGDGNGGVRARRRLRSSTLAQIELMLNAAQHPLRRKVWLVDLRH